MMSIPLRQVTNTNTNTCTAPPMRQLLPAGRLLAASPRRPFAAAGWRSRLLLVLLSAVLLSGGVAAADEADGRWLEFSGSGDGAAQGKHVVLIAGDEEYRSEELMPQLAKILSAHHGMNCTVLFSQDPETGKIDPNQSSHIPGLHRLQDADLMVIATRFRSLPAEQMKPIVDYLEAGKPVIGLRTATHAFNLPADHPYAKYSWSYGGEDYPQGFGRQVLGETWIAHHGKHGSESTRGIVADRDHPIARGIADGDIWGPTDVYTVRLPLSGDGHVVFLGAILTGMNADDTVVQDDRNDPMMPIGWTRTANGARVFTSTMGAASDFANAGVRRMIVNAAYWCLSLEDAITADLNVDTVGDFQPTPFGFNGFVRDRVPADYR